ncbi:MAG: hypothetical protein SGBAC_009387 [Bacillariaceae sp.]
MGNTLDKPKTEKSTCVGGSMGPEDGLSWGVSSMQGWRLTMEDAHICAPHAHNYGSDGDKLDTSGAESNVMSHGNNKSSRNQVSSEGQDTEGDQILNGPGPEHGEEPKADDTPKEDLKLPPHHFFFCVLDGHGGDFAANYSRDNLLPILLEQDAFQEYEKTWRASTTTTLHTSLSDCCSTSSNGSASLPSKFGSQKGKKRKNTWHSKNKEEKYDSHQQQQASKSKCKKNSNISKQIANRKQRRQDRNLGLQSQLLQRALEDAFVELDLMLLQEMVRRNMVFPPSPLPTASTMESDSKNFGDGWGTYDIMEEEEAAAAISINMMKSQNAKGETIPGTTAVAVLVTPDWIICANLGDSRASLLLSSSSSSNSANQNGNKQTSPNPHQTKKNKKSKQKERKKKSTDTKNGEEEYWTIVALSEDHKPDLPEEQTRIEAANGSVTMGGRVDGELAMSRAFGDFGFKETYPSQLYHCQSSSFITKRRDRRERRRIQARPKGGQKNGVDEQIDGENGQDLDWEKQRAMAHQLKVSCFPEVFSYPRGKLKEEGNGMGRQVDGGPTGKEKVLLLGCDGIWDVMTNENCHNMVQELFAEGETNMGLIAEEILDTCLKKGSRDNMTLMVVHFSDATKSMPSGAGSGVDGSHSTSGGGVLKRRKQRISAHQGKR